MPKANRKLAHRVTEPLVSGWMRCEKYSSTTEAVRCFFR